VYHGRTLCIESGQFGSPDGLASGVRLARGERLDNLGHADAGTKAVKSAKFSGLFLVE